MPCPALVVTARFAQRETLLALLRDTPRDRLATYAWTARCIRAIARHDAQAASALAREHRDFWAEAADRLGRMVAEGVQTSSAVQLAQVALAWQAEAACAALDFGLVPAPAAARLLPECVADAGATPATARAPRIALLRALLDRVELHADPQTRIRLVQWLAMPAHGPGPVNALAGAAFFLRAGVDVDPAATTQAALTTQARDVAHCLLALARDGARPAGPGQFQFAAVAMGPDASASATVDVEVLVCHAALAPDDRAAEALLDALARGLAIPDPPAAPHAPAPCPPVTRAGAALLGEVLDRGDAEAASSTPPTVPAAVIRAALLAHVMVWPRPARPTHIPSGPVLSLPWLRLPMTGRGRGGGPGGSPC
jgi:hypothetical protein